MKHFNNITTLIFDFGGVLINLDMSRCIQRFKNLGVENIDRYLGQYGQSDFFLQYEKGEINTQQFRNEIRKHAENKLTDEQIDDAWGAFLLDIPQAKIDMLIELRKKFRLLLLSNTNPLHIEISSKEESAKRGKTIHDYFDKCYLSYEMGLAKPQAGIFEAVLKDAGLNPSECLFLDDGPKNIEQAQNLGIQTYLVDTNEDLSFLLKTETFS